ncbi:MAG: hypothetical protein EHM61_21145 [Acidobacteria bacterium]|nr:MAG: hypothetical protein EHM61_21145 [Acidobacteriota bacterium]
MKTTRILHPSAKIGRLAKGRKSHFLSAGSPTYIQPGLSPFSFQLVDNSISTGRIGRPTTEAKQIEKLPDCNCHSPSWEGHMRKSLGNAIVLCALLTLGACAALFGTDDAMAPSRQGHQPHRLLHRGDHGPMIVDQSPWDSLRTAGFTPGPELTLPQSTPADANWSDVFRFSGPGLDGPVEALALDSAGQLFAGGNFTAAGGLSLNGIAKWDGSSWSTLGTGISGEVHSLLFDSSGNLYAGGSFSSAGGVTAANIAKWNGSSWAPLGAGLNGFIQALAMDPSGNLYAAGWLEDGTGNRIAKWDGNSWSLLPGAFNSDVNAIAVDAAGILYAAGYFETVDGTTVNRVARWNGTGWSALGDGFPDGVEALALDPAGTLYAGGWFGNSIARWNGTSWSPVGAGLGGPVRTLAFDPHGDLYAGGWIYDNGNFVNKWNGIQWSAVGQSLDNDVFALAVNDQKLYAGGYFNVTNGSILNYIAQLDSGAWASIGGIRPGCGTNGFVGAVAVDNAGTLYAAGGFTTAGGVQTAQGSLKWDGRTWSATGLPGDANSFAVDAAGLVYAGGQISIAGGNHIAVWDGGSWSPLPGSFGGDVTGLVFDPSGNLYAAGDFTQVDAITVNGIAKWNGSSWSALASGIQGDVYALASDPAGNLYVGGEISSAGGVSVNSIAKWNGTTWSALGSGIDDGDVYALACDSTGKVYAGGWISRAGGVNVSGIARWDGTSWSGVAGGVDGGIEDLVFDQAGALYATGWFSQAGGVPANNIAKWNGTAWSALGSGLDGYGYALAVSPTGSVFVGGWFSQAGGKSSSSIAEWSQTSPNALPLNSGRFKASVVWRSSGVSGAAQAVSLSSDSGYFWFFGPANLEMLVKILDGRGVNGYFWVFFGALTDVQYDLIITDTETGAVRTYYSAPGVQAGKNDTTAFSDSGASPASSPNLQQEAQAFELVLELVRRGRAPASLVAQPQSTILGLHSGRFLVDVQWSTPSGATGQATGVALTSESGYFWFFSAGNIELVVKMLDGRGVNGHFWFFYGALSDLGYTIRVTDTQTGAVKVYEGEQGVQKSGRDLAAF